MTGSKITSNNPIAVFAGSRCSDVPPGTAFCDYLVEQLIPVQMWGTVHPVPPIQNGTANLVRIWAGQNDTRVYIDDGAGTTAVQLQAGEFAEGIFDVPIVVTSSRPVLVGQYGAGAEALPFNDNRDCIRKDRGNSPVLKSAVDIPPAVTVKPCSQQGGGQDYR